MNDLCFFFQQKPEFQAQNPISHPLRSAQPETNVRITYI